MLCVCVCEEFKINFGIDWKCDEDCTSLSHAAADKHLTCCLHTDLHQQQGSQRRITLSYTTARKEREDCGQKS